MKRRFGRKGIYSLSLLIIAALLIGGISVARLRAQESPSRDPAAAAQALQASLTAEQRQAIKAIFDAHAQELAALAQNMAAAFPNAADLKAQLFLPLVNAQNVISATIATQTAPTTAPRTSSIARTAPGVAITKMTSDLEQVRALIEADIARILTPDQLVLYKAAFAIAPAADTGDVAAAQVSDAALQASDTNAVGCFNAAQWVSYALAYNQAAKAFAFMAAFNVDLGTETPAALQGYISFNEADSYALSGLEDLSTASVMLTADLTVQNMNGGTLFGVKGTTATQTAQDRIELAVANVLRDYLNSGGVVIGNVGVGGNYFAFFAYEYGTIADTFISGGLVRTPNCF